MNLGQFEELDAAMASKKRGRELAQAEQEMRDAQELEDKKNKANRGNYLCSRCNLPKKGHVCPFQPRYKRRDQSGDVGSAMVLDAAVQVEMDDELTLRALGDLDKQGTAESYFNVAVASNDSSSSVTNANTNTNSSGTTTSAENQESVDLQSGVKSGLSDSAQRTGVPS